MQQKQYSGGATRRTGRLVGGIVLAALAVASVSTIRAAAQEPFDANGNVGKTSYLTLPFQSSVFQESWGSSPYLTPGELYFSANPASAYNNPKQMSDARESAASIEQKGLVPMSGAQRWEDTWQASRPYVQGEKPWVTSDRTNFKEMGPDYQAWSNWVLSHPQYWDTAFDGGTMPLSQRPNQWAYISYDTTLDPADCPPGMTSATYGDLFAYLWGKTAKLSGAYGCQMSDFSDSQPYEPGVCHDFNPRRIAAFAAQRNLDGSKFYPNGVPGSSIAQKASYLVSHDFNRWTDFLSVEYGNFFSALATNMGEATGRIGLVSDQGAFSAACRRMQGSDQRILLRHISPKSYVCMWDEHSISPERGGPVAGSSPEAYTLAGTVVASAREPLARNGANLESDASDFWQAIAKFYPSLSPQDRREVGYKLMKRLWLWDCFAHIADRSGHVRRALAFTSRDYWDAGTLTALDPLTTLIQTIVPARPFGPAFYYPVSVERKTEQMEAQASGAGDRNLAGYLSTEDLEAFLDNGVPCGYYVSDAALGRIVKGSSNAPSAWIVSDPSNLLPPAERKQLAAVAPVVTSAPAYGSLSDQPLKFSNGMNGFGFYDQGGRLILVATNPSRQPTAGSISGNIMLARTGFADGTHTVTNLMTGAASQASFSAGAATIPANLSRWDTLIVAVSP